MNAEQEVADVRTQVAKLLIIPFVCMVERCWLGRTFTRPVILSMLVVVGGVAIVYDPIYFHGNLWLLCTECMSFFRHLLQAYEYLFLIFVFGAYLCI